MWLLRLGPWAEPAGRVHGVMSASFWSTLGLPSGHHNENLLRYGLSPGSEGNIQSRLRPGRQRRAHDARLRMHVHARAHTHTHTQNLAPGLGNGFSVLLGSGQGSGGRRGEAGRVYALRLERPDQRVQTRLHGASLPSRKTRSSCCCCF